jgi:aspartate/methionine/tyrosine aminotransferase
VAFIPVLREYLDRQGRSAAWDLFGSVINLASIGGIVAVRDGESLVTSTVARLRASRDLLVESLAALPGTEVAPPPGAMYLFFRIAGRSDDSLAFAKRLVAESGLGIAPGVAFGPEGEGFLRWCFAASDALLLQGVERLQRFLARR